MRNKRGRLKRLMGETSHGWMPGNFVAHLYIVMLSVELKQGARIAFMFVAILLQMSKG